MLIPSNFDTLQIITMSFKTQIARAFMGSEKSSNSYTSVFASAFESMTEAGHTRVPLTPSKTLMSKPSQSFSPSKSHQIKHNTSTNHGFGIL